MNLNFSYQFDGRGRTQEATLQDYVKQLVEQVLFTSPGERVLYASVTPPQPPESETPLSSASWSRPQSATIIPPVWKKTTSSSDAARVVHPSAS